MTGRPGHAGETHGSDERAPRSLSGPLLRFALTAESRQLRAERPYLEGDRNANTLIKVDWFRLVLVTLRAGAIMDEAAQHGSVALQVLDGEVVVRVGDESVNVGVQEVSVVAPGYPWVAVAMADTVLLLHLAWPPVPGSSAT